MILPDYFLCLSSVLTMSVTDIFFLPAVSRPLHQAWFFHSPLSVPGIQLIQGFFQLSVFFIRGPENLHVKLSKLFRLRFVRKLGGPYAQKTNRFTRPYFHKQTAGSFIKHFRIAGRPVQLPLM